MKKLLLFTIFLSAFFAFNSQAKISTNTVTSLILPQQGILPNYGPNSPYTFWQDDMVGRNAFSEGYIIIMRIDLVQSAVEGVAEDNQRFRGVSFGIAETSGENFFEVDSSVIINQGGEILGVAMGAGDIDITHPNYPNGAPISIPTDTTGNRYFIAIRTTDNTEDRSWATFTVPAGGVNFGPPAATPPDALNGEVTTGPLTCELRIADILPHEYDNIHDPFYSGDRPRYPSYFQWHPGEMIRPLYGVDSIMEYTGTAGVGSDEDILVDLTQNWTAGSLVGGTVYNLTQGGSAVITANTSVTITTNSEFPWEEDDSYRVFKSITADAYAYSQTPLEHEVPQVLPWETRTAYLAIACAQRNLIANGTATPAETPQEVLSSVTVTVTAGDSGAANFDPNKTFRTSSENHGITLWQDNNQNGIWEPATDSLLGISYSSGGTFTQTAPEEWVLTLFPSGEGIQIDQFVDDLFDYFVVIEQRSDYSADGGAYRPKMGQDYKIWVKPSNVRFGPIAYPERYAGIDAAFVKTIYNNIFLEDLSQERVDPVEITADSDQTYNIIPVIGINAAAGPMDISGTLYNFAGTKLQSVRVELLSVERFDPGTDLAPLTGDISGGLSLWRDSTSGDKGSFDSGDTFIPTNNTGWTYDGFESGMFKYSTTLTLQAWATDPGNMHPHDYHTDYPHGGTITNKTTYRGDDFYLALRTSEFLSYGATFKVRIPYEGVWTTAPKAAYNTLPLTTGEIKGNVFTRITTLTGPGNPEMEPNSPPTAVFKVELNDNASGKNTQLEGLSVEFYDRGNFTLDDLASFVYVSPVFNPATGWNDITNLDAEELKKCGVVIYRDEALTDPVRIIRYRRLSFPGMPDGYQFEFLNPVNIPATLYAAIRTSPTFTEGDSFDAGIVGWGLHQPDWDAWGSRAVPVIDIDGLQTTSYPRVQSGTFNPPVQAEIDLDSESEYDFINFDWTHASSLIPAGSFVRYEVVRDGTVIALIDDINQTWYQDRRDGTNPPADGTDYTYSVNIVYNQAGYTYYLDSNQVTTRILSFDDSQLPWDGDDFRLVPGTNSVTLIWADRSYNPNDSDTFDDRASSFFFKRTYHEDNSTATFSVPSQFSETNPDNPDNIWHEYLDGFLLVDDE